VSAFAKLACRNSRFEGKAAIQKKVAATCASGQWHALAAAPTNDRSRLFFRQLRLRADALYQLAPTPTHVMPRLDRGIQTLTG